MSDLIRGRYEPLEVVGHGGQGMVIRARDVEHDRIVALKIYELDSEHSLGEAKKEARLLLTIKPHPNLPIVREDFVFDANRYCIVMDWIEGVSLAHVLEREAASDLRSKDVRWIDNGKQSSTFKAKLHLLRDLADALEHLHTHEPVVIHSDVKPSNIVIAPKGRAVLVDFGISSIELSNSLSHVSPGYAAPELMAGQPPSQATDVYGFAATACALLTGAPPRIGLKPGFPGLNRFASRRVRRALRRPLSIDPSRRPKSARAVVDALRSIPSRLAKPHSNAWKVVRAATIGLLAIAVSLSTAKLTQPVTPRRIIQGQHAITHTKRPQHIATTDAGRSLIVSHNNSGVLSVIDPVSREYLGDIDVGVQKVTHLGTDSTTGQLIVVGGTPDTENGFVIRVNPVNRMPVSRIPVSEWEYRGVTVDDSSGGVYLAGNSVTGPNHVTVVESDGTVRDLPELSSQLDGGAVDALGVDPHTGSFIVVSGLALARISPSGEVVRQTRLSPQKGHGDCIVTSVLVAPEADRIYVPNSCADVVDVVSYSNLNLVGRLDFAAIRVVLAPDSRRAFVVGPNGMAIIDTGSTTIVDSSRGAFVDVALGQDGHAYLVDPENQSIAAYEYESESGLTGFTVPIRFGFQDPRDITVTPDGLWALVRNEHVGYAGGSGIFFSLIDLRRNEVVRTLAPEIALMTDPSDGRVYRLRDESRELESHRTGVAIETTAAATAQSFRTLGTWSTSDYLSQGTEIGVNGKHDLVAWIEGNTTTFEVVEIGSGRSAPMEKLPGQRNQCLANELRARSSTGTGGIELLYGSVSGADDRVVPWEDGFLVGQLNGPVSYWTARAGLEPIAPERLHALLSTMAFSHRRAYGLVQQTEEYGSLAIMRLDRARSEDDPEGRTAMFTPVAGADIGATAVHCGSQFAVEKDSGFILEAPRLPRTVDWTDEDTDETYPERVLVFDLRSGHQTARLAIGQPVSGMGVIPNGSEQDLIVSNAHADNVGIWRPEESAAN